MRPKLSTAVAGVILLALSACADLRLANLRAELEGAESRWQQAGMGDYDYTLRWVCFCPDEKVRITVRDGSLESIETVPPGLPLLDPSRYGPVEDLFAFLRDAIDGRAFAISVEYDPAIGVPTMSSIDYLRYAIDDETGFVIEDFAHLPVLGMGVGRRR